MSPLAPGSRRFALAATALLVVGAAALALLVEPTPPVSPREGEALEGAARIGRVLAGVESGAPAVEGAWQRRGGQPPLAGLFQGASWWAFQAAVGARPGAAVADLLAGLLIVALVFALARRRYGWLPAAGAALLLLATPGFLAAMRAVRPEPIVGAAFLLVVGAAWAADRGPTQAFLATLAFVLAVCAHPVGLLLFLPLWLWAAWRAPAAPPGPGGGMVSLPPFPPWALLAPVAGVVLLAALWPWLRVETGKRLLEYVLEGHMSFHPPFLLLGDVFVQGRESAPPFWTAPLLWTLRLPLPILALALLGGARGLRVAWRLRRGAGPDGRGTGPADRDLLLPALVALTLLAVHALNGTPWYEGNDDLLVALPLLALLAAAGLETCVRRLHESPHPALGRLALPFVAAVVLCGAAARISAGDTPDTWWNALAGGPANVARVGLQLRPAPSLPAPLIDWMNTSLPKKAAVTFLPDAKGYRTLLRRLADASVLRGDLFFGDLFNADYVVLTFAPEDPGYPEAVAFTADRTPVFRVDRGSVPLALVHAPSPR